MRMALLDQLPVLTRTFGSLFASDKLETEYFINEQPLIGYKLGDGYSGTCEELMSVGQCSSLAIVRITKI